MIMDFNRSWQTYTTPEPEEWHLPRVSREVDLPHDDNIRFDTAKDNVSSHAGAYYPGCSVEYEKVLTLNDDWKLKRISLGFDGVYHNAVVRVNQQFVHRNHYGYTAFCCNMTPFLKEGDNLIRVSAANKDVPNSRWYTGTGIFRQVELLVQEYVFMPYRSAVLNTVNDGKDALVTARITVQNETDETALRQVRVTLTNPDGAVVTKQEVQVEIHPNCDKEATLTLRVDEAKWWSDETPWLYDAKVELLQDDRLTDSVSLAYGLRTIAFSAREGFLLNGVPTKLRGGCVHHDHGILGGASFDKAEERKVRALKACGYNAIRSSHNPASDALLKACDKYGMLVMDEAFDMWREPKMPYDNSIVFELTWRTDLEAMVRRDRNHACVIMYCTGNEVPERDGHSDGNRISGELTDYLHQLDPTRPVINALNNVSPQDNVNGLAANLLDEQDYFLTATKAFAAPLDIVGYNYMRSRLEKDHDVYPERIFCATETVGCDIFHGWDVVERCSYVIGDFLWTAVDYLGEVGVGRTEVENKTWGLADYPYRLSGCGDLDVCCRKKPRSYYRDCVWGIAKRPYMAIEDPALYDKKTYPMWWGWPIVQEYWNYPGFEGKPTRICIYSMADEVALYLSGEMVGRAPAGKKNEYKANFDVAYRPGELMAVEYVNGLERARHAICTPDAQRMIRLSADKASLDSSMDDLLFVDARLTDSIGNPILYDDRIVTFEVEGGATFLAAGSGAIKTTTNYTNPNQLMDLGHVQCVLRVKQGQSGLVTLRCKSEGLQDAMMTIEVK